MGIGWIVSLIFGGIMMVVIIVIAISLERKYIVRENGRINYKKTTIFLRWNVLDTLTLVLSIYTILCVQALNMLVSSGQTVENPYVQFFTNQSQVWVTVDILYLVTRVSNTMKAIKAHWGDELDDEQ
ncbi:group-specific protein [Lysinibacillus sp. B2A1]|nr:group-specific protein [Lysinibacillus sp. B2A1]